MYPVWILLALLWGNKCNFSYSSDLTIQFLVRKVTFINLFYSISH